MKPDKSSAQPEEQRLVMLIIAKDMSKNNIVNEVVDHLEDVPFFCTGLSGADEA
jgi:hypothetical protein